MGQAGQRLCQVQAVVEGSPVSLQKVSVAGKENVSWEARRLESGPQQG